MGEASLRRLRTRPRWPTWRRSRTRSQRRSVSPIFPNAHLWTWSLLTSPTLSWRDHAGERAVTNTIPIFILLKFQYDGEGASTGTTRRLRFTYSWYLTEESAKDRSSVTCNDCVFEVSSLLKKWEILFESHSSKPNWQNRQNLQVAKMLIKIFIDLQYLKILTTFSRFLDNYSRLNIVFTVIITLFSLLKLCIFSSLRKCQIYVVD